MLTPAGEIFSKELIKLEGGNKNENKITTTKIAGNR
jgi:hypothetical protein